MTNKKPNEKTPSERQANVIYEMVDCICDNLPYVVLKQYDQNWNEENEELIVELTFNRGTNVYKISINWYGVIKSYSKKIPKHMLVDISNGISEGYLKEIFKEMRSQGINKNDF